MQHSLTTHLKSGLLKDARHFQIVYLGAFMLFGVFYLGWDTEIARITTILGTALLVQFLGARYWGASPSSWKSAMITGLGMSLLLHTSVLWVAALGAALAIGSKFLIKHQGKHVFNPGNLGIVLAVLLTGEAWISPGQWGSGVLLVFFFGAAALMVLLKVGRIDTSLAFLGTFAALEAIRSVAYLGWGWDVVFHKLTNGSLLLFAFFMITDPVTTPKHPAARIIWSVFIGALAFVLSQWFYVHTAPIWALFFAAPLTALFNALMKGQTFQWITN